MYRLTPQHVMTSFVGREQDVRVITALFQRSDVRIVTLTGPGGVGKTRLAFHVAEQLRSSFPDGVVSVDLSTTTMPDLVMPAIAREFGIIESGSESIEARLLRIIGDKRTLIVIDNFEQVTAAGMIISRLASECPNSAFLITSRMPLHILGEHEYEVIPLATPPLDGTGPDGQDPGSYPAVRLFVQRAQAANRAFQPNAEMLVMIGRITALLDGLPLAIELAAARTKLFSLPALLNRLDNRMGLLTGGPRDLPDRLQTMRNAIAWSHELLSPEERIVFRRVAVFTDSFSLDEAEAVIEAPLSDEEWAFIDAQTGSVPDAQPVADVLGHLESLIDKSLLRTSTGVHDDVRFRMMLTLQEFGRGQLRDTNELLLMQVRLLTHLFTYLERLDQELFGPDQRLWLDRLDQELGNLRVVLQISLDYPETYGEYGVHLASSLWRYWLVRGHVSEGMHWLERTLACRDRVELPILMEAEALNHLGNLRLDLAMHEQAERNYEESLKLYREIGYRDGIADELNNLGLVQLLQGKREEARGSLGESLRLRREDGDPAALPATLSNLGDLAVEDGDYDRAEALYAESLGIRREVGNLRGMAISCHSLGLVAFYRGEYERAQTWFDEGLEYQVQLDDVYSLALLMLGLARLNLATDNPLLAMERLNRALEVFQRMGARRMLLLVIDAIAGAAERYGFIRESARLLGTTHSVRQREKLHIFEREQRELEQLRQSLAERLGRDVMEREFAVGERQWLNQAVQEAGALTGRIREKLETGETEPTVESGAFNPVNAARRAKELGLTRRERQVLALLVRGASDKEIADVLSIAPRTAMTHVSNILNKLGVNRRTAAASLALREGLVDPSEANELAIER